ncbi:Uncharacterised protein [Streptococcus pneumoniae]|nr:Uncharacterised protein [Streptococcus pneumoniae]
MGKLQRWSHQLKVHVREYLNKYWISSSLFSTLLFPLTDDSKVDKANRHQEDKEQYCNC